MAKISKKQWLFIIGTAIVFTFVAATPLGAGVGPAGLKFGQAGFTAAFWKAVALQAGIQIGISLLAQELFDEGGDRGPTANTRDELVRAQVAPARWRFGRVMVEGQGIWHEPSGEHAVHRITPLSNGVLNRLVMMISPSHAFHIPLLRGVHVINQISRWHGDESPGPSGETLGQRQGPGATMVLPHSYNIGISTLRYIRTLFAHIPGARTLISQGAFVRGTNTRVDQGTRRGGRPGPMPLVLVEEHFDDSDKPAGRFLNETRRWRRLLSGDGTTLLRTPDREPYAYNDTFDTTRRYQPNSDKLPATGAMRWGPENIGLGISYVHEKIIQSDDYRDGGWYDQGVAWTGVPRFRYLIEGIKIPDGLIPDETTRVFNSGSDPRPTEPEGRVMRIEGGEGDNWTSAVQFHNGYTKNPALLRAYFLIDRMGVKPERIDPVALQESMAICDETVVFYAKVATLSFAFLDRKNRNAGLIPDSERESSYFTIHSPTSAVMADEDTYIFVEQYAGGAGRAGLIRLYRAVPMSGYTLPSAKIPNTASNSTALISTSRVIPAGRNDERKADQELVQQIKNTGQWSIDDPNSGWVPLCYFRPMPWGANTSIFENLQPYDVHAAGQARLYNGEIWVHEDALTPGYWTPERSASNPAAEEGWEKLGGAGAYHVEVPYGEDLEWMEEMPGMMKRYEAHGEIVAGESLLGPFRHIDRAMDGHTTLWDGKHYIRAGRGERLDTTVSDGGNRVSSTGILLPPGVKAVIRDEDLVNLGLGDVQVGPSRENEFTGCSFSILQDEFRNWRARQFPLYDKKREADSGERLESRRKVRFDFVTNPIQARQIANAFLLDARSALFIPVETRAFAGSTGFPLVELMPGDVVLLQLSELGWEEGDRGHRMQIQRVELNNEDFSLGLELVTQEYGNTRHYFELPDFGEDSPQTASLVRIAPLSASVAEGGRVGFVLTRTAPLDDPLDVVVRTSRSRWVATGSPAVARYTFEPGVDRIELSWQTRTGVLREDGWIQWSIDGAENEGEVNSGWPHYTPFIVIDGEARTEITNVVNRYQVNIRLSQDSVQEGGQVVLSATRTDGDRSSDAVYINLRVTGDMDAIRHYRSDRTPDILDIFIDNNEQYGEVVINAVENNTPNPTPRSVTFEHATVGAHFDFGGPVTLQITDAAPETPIQYGMEFGEDGIAPPGLTQMPLNGDTVLRLFATDGRASDTDEDISLVFSGTGVLGEDYGVSINGDAVTSSPYQLSFPAGDNEVSFDVNAFSTQRTCSITVTATRGSDTIGPVTLNLLPTVSVRPVDDSASFGDDLHYIFERSDAWMPVAGAAYLTVNFRLHHFFTPSPPYDGDPPSSITLPATGASTLAVPTLDQPQGATGYYGVRLIPDESGPGWLRDPATTSALISVFPLRSSHESVSVAGNGSVDVGRAAEFTFTRTGSTEFRNTFRFQISDPDYVAGGDETGGGIDGQVLLWFFEAGESTARYPISTHAAGDITATVLTGGSYPWNVGTPSSATVTAA